MPERLPPPGTFVWIRRRRWRVRESRRDRTVVRLDVDRGDERRVFLAPFDRLSPETERRRPVGVRRQRLRHLGRSLAGRCRPARGLAPSLTARIDVLPHQLEPALATAAGACRILIADEVGLGKTIQAGLIARLVTDRRPSSRVLVVVPPGLVAQWMRELSGRFDIPVGVIDQAQLDGDLRKSADRDDPWRRPGTRIVSADFVRQPHVINAVPAVPWDLLVVDEAHGVCGDSDRHRAMARLARDAQRVVLLTATPHSGDTLRFDRLCRLGSLGTTADDLLTFRRTRADIGRRRARRVSCHRVAPGVALEHLLSALFAFERAVLTRADRSRQPGAILLLSVFRKRALSTAQAALSTFRRRLQWLEQAGTGRTVDEPDQLRLVFRDDDDDDEGALAIATGLPAKAERSWLSRLAELAARAAAVEPKASRVADLLSRTSEPAVVFTEFRASVPVVVARLGGSRTVAVLHGGLSSAEREYSLRRFEDGRANVLVATDVASQGLNLQRAARWVVSLDLPWNPARLEQRFGRVDRLGQERPVHLTLVVARHPAEDALLGHLRRRTRAAERALGRGSFGELLDGLASEEEIGRSLITGESLDIAPPPHLGPCTRFRRPARSHAGTIQRLRRLAAVAAGDRHQEFSGRPVRGRGLNRSGAMVLCFEVVLTTSRGSLVERMPAAVRVEDSSGRPHTALLAAAEEVVRQRMTPRLRRLVRWHLASTRAIDRRLDNMGARLLTERAVAETQPGLFDRRAEASWLADERRLTRSLDDVARARVEVNDPTLSARIALRAVLLPS